MEKTNDVTGVTTRAAQSTASCHMARATRRELLESPASSGLTSDWHGRWDVVPFLTSQVKAGTRRAQAGHQTEHQAGPDGAPGGHQAGTKQAPGGAPRVHQTGHQAGTKQVPGGHQTGTRRGTRRAPYRTRGVHEGARGGAPGRHQAGTRQDTRRARGRHEAGTRRGTRRKARLGHAKKLGESVECGVFAVICSAARILSLAFDPSDLADLTSCLFRHWEWCVFATGLK